MAAAFLKRYTLRDFSRKTRHYCPNCISWLFAVNGDGVVKSPTGKVKVTVGRSKPYRPDVAATYTLCHMGSSLTDIDGQISKSCIIVSQLRKLMSTIVIIGFLN